MGNKENMKLSAKMNSETAGTIKQEQSSMFQLFVL